MSRRTLHPLATIGLYRPGRSVLHRARPGTKLVALALFATVVLLVRGLPATAAALAVAVGVAFVAGFGLRQLAQVVRGFLIIGGLLFAFQWWRNGPDRAAELTGELLALLIASSVLTATTAVDDMIDTIVRGLGPLRRFGVVPEAVGLAFSLAIRAIPVTAALATETRDAARARGLERSTRAFATPLVIRVVAHARETGAALHARGIGDDDWGAAP